MKMATPDANPVTSTFAFGINLLTHVDQPTNTVKAAGKTGLEGEGTDYIKETFVVVAPPRFVRDPDTESDPGYNEW